MIHCLLHGLVICFLWEFGDVSLNLLAFCLLFGHCQFLFNSPTRERGGTATATCLGCLRKNFDSFSVPYITLSHAKN